MKLTEKQIFGIKIVLSEKSKSQIFTELGIDNSYFSKIERHPNAQLKLNEYFDKINPEINLTVQKWIEPNFNQVNDLPVPYTALSPQTKLMLEEKEKRIKVLEDDLATHKRLDAYMEKRYQEYQIEKDGLLEIIRQLGGDPIYKKETGS